MKTSRLTSLLMLGVITSAFLLPLSSDAQTRKGIRRSSLSKKELDERYDRLRKELPTIKTIERSEQEIEREKVREKAFAVVDQALGKELEDEIQLEAQRTKETSTVNEVLLAADKGFKDAQDGLSAADAKGFQAVSNTKLSAAFSRAPVSAQKQTPADDSKDFDGLNAVTSDGKTFTVPGIDAAKSFDGSVVPVEGNGPAPGPKPQPRIEKKKGKSEVTEITCTGEAVFSSTGTEEQLAEGKKAGPPIVIFKENVVVINPGFSIHCDRLIAYMKDTNGADDAEGGIERVIATGREVIIVKKLADGTQKIGKARKLTYNAITGDVILEDRPQVQSGQNIQMASDPSVVMTMKKDGRVFAKGATKTFIVPNSGEESLIPGQN
jgi:lipopolysaccharide transport protein LptA